MPPRELFPSRPWISAAFALIAGLLLPISLAPFDFWWSGPVSILMLLAVLRGASFKQALVRWYLFGIGQFILGASWVYVSIHTHGGASIFLAGLLVSLFVAGISLVVLLQGFVYQRFFAHSQYLWILAFPSLWFYKEWTTTWLLSGFPWALLGYGQLESPFSGYAPVLGVLGIGFIVVLFVSLFYAGVLAAGSNRAKWWAASLSIILVGAGLAFLETTKMGFTKAMGEPMEVSLVQGNIAQQTKWRRDRVDPIIQTYLSLSAEEWGRDLIVWPEAAITLFEDSAEPLLEAINDKGKASQTALLLGLPSRDEIAYYNSARLLGDGAGKYVKRQLVPFGEYVPFENTLRGVIEFFDLPMSRNQPGPDQQPPMNVQGLPIALSICYEIAFPDLVRRDGGGSAFLVTISNDTWFGESLGPHQHMQMAQMRALENRRFLARATNNGITAVVNEKGAITASLPQFEAGVLRASIQPRTGATPYSRLGDWPLLIILVSCLGGWLFRGRMRSNTADVQQ